MKSFQTPTLKCHEMYFNIQIFNVELSDLYSLPNIVRVVKSRRMRWAGHVARMGEERGVHRVLVGKPEGKSHWGDPDIDGRIILRWTCRKWEEVVGTRWIWLRIGIRWRAPVNKVMNFRVR